MLCACTGNKRYFWRCRCDAKKNNCYLERRASPCVLCRCPTGRTILPVSLTAAILLIIIAAVIGTAIYLLRRLKPKDPPDKFDA